MIAKIAGILLLITGAVVILTGVSAMFAAADGQAVSHSTIGVRMFAGFFIAAAGLMTFAFAFSGRAARSVVGIVNRLRGSRIDEEIARLAKLRGDGYITGEEYEAAKKKLLDNL